MECRSWLLNGSLMLKRMGWNSMNWKVYCYLLNKSNESLYEYISKWCTHSCGNVMPRPGAHYCKWFEWQWRYTSPNEMFYGRSNMLRTFGACSYTVKLLLCPVVEVCTSPAFGVNLPKSSIIKWKWHMIMFSEEFLVMIDFPVLVKCL